MSRELSFAPEQAALRRARSDVREAAAGLGASERICDTAALVLDELVNNAIEHGESYRRQNLELAVRVSVADAGLALEFFDREMPESEVRELSAARGDATKGAPSLESERGRGLFLLSIYLEGLSVDVDTNGGLCLRGIITGGD